MINETAQQKLGLMKKIGKVLGIITLITSIVAGVMLFLFLLMPATNLQLNSGKYTSGYNYYGWQLAIIGYGYPPVQDVLGWNPLALFEDISMFQGDFVPTTYDFSTNILLLMAIVLPILIMIIGFIVAKKMKNKGKAICEFVVAVGLIIGAVILANCASISVLTAMSSGTTNFYASILSPAIEQGGYVVGVYPVLLCVCLIIIALFKAAYGAFLLYQRAYAQKVKKAQ